jgi:NADH-quinone oxidoreductase subunit G
LQQIYHESLPEDAAHKLLHTGYENRKRITQDDIVLSQASGEHKLTLNICFGTSCFIRGAQTLYMQLMEYIRQKGLADQTEFTASFCGKQCKKGPVVVIGGKTIEHCNYELAVAEIEKALVSG